MLIEPTLRSELLAGQVAVVTGEQRGIGEHDGHDVGRERSPGRHRRGRRAEG